uniref:DUF4371 domain-containing protein n=1 Tax=Latimeria chalumnae TaxID=7897 RepID=H3A1Q2_LATCH
TVHYFSKTEGIKYGLLDFYHDNDETSDAIAACISNIIEENGLSINCMSSYVADNASVNFGKHRSVYQKLKQLNDRMIQVGCKCHVIHNCVKNGMKALSFDTERLILKVYSKFSSSTKKTESLSSFSDFVEIEYKKLLRHVPTRWLFLLPAIEQVLQCWPALKAYFISEGEEEADKALSRCITYLEKWYDFKICVFKQMS